MGNFEDARDAKHSKSRIILFDKAAVVEPVYESRSEAPAPSYQPRRRSITPPPGPPGGGYPRYRSRSPGDYRGSSGSREDYRGSPIISWRTASISWIASSGRSRWWGYASSSWLV